ncbi:MAG TPA: hypothetical protein VI485_30755 [Vicinamibacterales bacterium]|nr:hypothetical protein [Vicinamibacterales bacterium]
MATDSALVVKELAGAVSAQAQVANRSWLALIIVAIVASLPRAKSADTALPFGLGVVEPGSFHLVMFGLLAVLIIGFAAAHAQQVRAQRLAQRALKALTENAVLGGSIHARDLFDMLRLPGVNRVAPLAQLLKGQDAFYNSVTEVPTWRRNVSRWYYLLLKAASWLVYFLYPGVALWASFALISAPWWAWWPSLAAGLVSTAALLHVFVVDFRYVMEVQEIIPGS